jgi:hypothetical protein
MKPFNEAIGLRVKGSSVDVVNIEEGGEVAPDL